MIKTIKCKHCGVKFETDRKRGFCTALCRHRYWVAKNEKRIKANSTRYYIQHKIELNEKTMQNRKEHYAEYLARINSPETKKKTSERMKKYRIKLGMKWKQKNNFRIKFTLTKEGGYTFYAYRRVSPTRVYRIYGEKYANYDRAYEAAMSMI